VCHLAAASTDDGEQNLDLSLGSSTGSNKRGSLDGIGGGDDDGAAGSDQRVPMAFELDWQSQMAARSTKAKVHAPTWPRYLRFNCLV
jgi:AP2-like factor (euAP2 lineage)